MSHHRQLVLLVSLLASSLSPGGVEAADQDLAWHDVLELGLEGRGWSDTRHPFDRLPDRAEEMVRPPVWSLAQHSSGLSVRFLTDATTVSVRWTLRNDRLAMPHMPATGVSGVDLYARREGRWHFVAVGRPLKFPVNEAVLARDLAGRETEYRLYLPLYNGVERVEIGVPASASFGAAPALVRSDRTVVIYGTSITQGGCASRPGMSYPAILGRRLDIPVINLGFSGNGKAEPEMARLLAELRPAAFVLDSLPNLETEQVGERLPPFIEILREQNPEVPILLIENLIYPDSEFLEARAQRHRGSNDLLGRIYADRVARGDRFLFYVPARDLIGLDGEGTVDGTHPTDLGFSRMADAIEPYLRKALE